MISQITGTLKPNFLKTITNDNARRFNQYSDVFLSEKRCFLEYEYVPAKVYNNSSLCMQILTHIKLQTHAKFVTHTKI